jgi:hypothetical protein
MIAAEPTTPSSANMSREVTSRNVPGGELDVDVPLSLGDHFGERINIIAYRGGDKFLFGGCISRTTSNGITASVVGDLTVGELVCLQYSINSSEQLERHARLRQQQGEECDFEFLSLNEQQIRCLTETCDWSLAADLC